MGSPIKNLEIYGALTIEHRTIQRDGQIVREHLGAITAPIYQYQIQSDTDMGEGPFHVYYVEGEINEWEHVGAATSCVEAENVAIRDVIESKIRRRR